MKQEIDRLGAEITSRCSLLVATRDGTAIRRYQIVEVEVYATCEQHPDPFTHCHPEQLLESAWYFHRASRSPTAGYREGTYKGLDIALGTRGGDGERHVGVLIRSIGWIEYARPSIASCNVINGPCLVVAELLRVAEVESVKDYVALLRASLADPTEPLSTLHPLLSLCYDASLPLVSPLSSPRVGLRVHDEPLDALASIGEGTYPIARVYATLAFRWARYRFVAPNAAGRVKKGAELMVASLLLDGVSIDQASEMSDRSLAWVTSLAASLATASRRTALSAVGPSLVKPAEIVGAYVSWHRFLRVAEDEQLWSATAE
jgi:hypothetical protein